MDIVQIILIYIVVAVIATVTSTINSKIGVVKNSMYLCAISLPVIVLTAGVTVVLSFLYLKLFLIIVAVILMLLKKIKFILGAKLVTLLGLAIASIFGFVFAPISWIVYLILFIIFIGYTISFIKETFVKSYHFFYRLMAAFFMVVRRQCDRLRDRLPFILKYFVLLIEIPLITVFSVITIWKAMEYYDSKALANLELQEIVYIRCIVIIPFIISTYSAYLKNTAPPNTGGKNPEVPTFDDLRDAYQVVFS